MTIEMKSYEWARMMATSIDRTQLTKMVAESLAVRGIDALIEADTAKSAEILRLREAIKWVIRDASFKAPEQAVEAAGVWMGRLQRALTGDES